jgi:hypothetical protein
MPPDPLENLGLRIPNLRTPIRTPRPLTLLKSGPALNVGNGSLIINSAANNTHFIRTNIVFSYIF